MSVGCFLLIFGILSKSKGSLSLAQETVNGDVESYVHFRKDVANDAAFIVFSDE